MKSIKDGKVEYPKKNAPKWKKYLMTGAIVTAIGMSLGGCSGESDLPVKVHRNGDSDVVSADVDISKEDVEIEHDKYELCAFNKYAVLEINGELSSHMYGSKVKIGDREYTIEETVNDGPALRSDDGDLYIIHEEGTYVDGAVVKFLGNGTNEKNACTLSIEVYEGVNSPSVKTKSELIREGAGIEMDLDESYHVNVKVNSVVKTEKVTYAEVNVDVFVVNTDGNNTYIASKSETHVVKLNEIAKVVVDEDTKLSIGLDLLAVGATLSEATLNVDGEDVNVKAGDVIKPEYLDAEVKVKEIMSSNEGAYAKVEIRGGNNIVVKTMMEGEVVRVDTGEGQLLRVELVSAEEICE